MDVVDTPPGRSSIGPFSPTSLDKAKESTQTVLMFEVELKSEEKTSPMSKKVISATTCLLSCGLSKACDNASRRLIVHILNESYYNKEMCQALVDEFTKIHGESSQKIKVAIKDTNVVLDGMFIRANQEGNVSDQRWLIRLHGMSERYEVNLDDAQKQAKDLNVNVVVFNYRGTGESEGQASKAQHYVDDSLAMIECLKKMKVPLENIIVQGHSFGGGVAAEVVMRDKTQSMLLVSLQSFSTFGKATKDYVNDITLGTLGAAAGATVRGAGFSFNTVKLYEKDNTLADRTFIFHSGDEDKMVSERVSLAKGLKDKDVSEIQEIKKNHVLKEQRERYKDFIETSVESKLVRKFILSELDKHNDIQGMSKVIFNELYKPVVRSLYGTKTADSFDENFDTTSAKQVFAALKRCLVRDREDSQYDVVIQQLEELEKIILRLEEDPHLQPLSDFGGAHKALKAWIEKKAAERKGEESASEIEGKNTEYL